MFNKKIDRVDGDHGFTLIEILVAIAIFTFGILTILALQISAIRGNLTTRMATEASSWAADRIEKLMGLSFDDSDIASGTHQAQSSDNKYNIDWTVVNNDLDSDGDTDIKIIEVIVSWDDLGIPKSRIYDLIKENNL